MKKYLTVFQISWQDELIYRLNFVLWRLRNILRFLMTYFLWKGVFQTNVVVFGFSQGQILSYLFLVLAVQAIVFAAPSNDNIGSEIGSGDLSNYLVKPIGYLKYWFTRDVASKLLNLIFAVFEIGILFFIFKPNLYLPLTAVSLGGFLISCAFAMVIYYFLSVSARFVAFWTPENTWGLAFVILIFVEAFGGSLFPLSILPPWLYSLIQITPFPYLVYFPIAILTGKIVGLSLISALLRGFLWSVVMYIFTKFVWKKGLFVYQASGR